MSSVLSIDADEEPTPLLGLKLISPSRRTNGHQHHPNHNSLSRVTTLLHGSSRSVSHCCRDFFSSPASAWQKLLSFSSIRRVRVVVALLLLYLLAVAVLAVTSETRHSMSYYLLSPFSYRPPGIGALSSPNAARRKSSVRSFSPRNLSSAAPLASAGGLPTYNTRPERCVDQLAQPAVLSHWLGVTFPSASAMSISALANDGSIVQQELPSVASRVQQLRANNERDLRAAPFEQLWNQQAVEHALTEQIEAIDWSKAPSTEYSTLPSEVAVEVEQVQHEAVDVQAALFPLPFAAERDNTAAFLLVPSFSHPSLLTAESGTFGSMLQHINPNATADNAPSYLHKWTEPLTQATAADFTLLAPPAPARLCAALLVPQIASRTYNPYPDFPRFGPDSARMAMHAERAEGGFEEYLNFDSVLYKERRWTDEDGWLPLDDAPRDGVGGSGTLGELRVERTEKRDMTVSVVVAGKPRKVRAQVRVTLRVVVRYSVRYDVGFSLYVADVVMPPLHQPDLLASSGFASAVTSLTSLLTQSAPSGAAIAPFPFVDERGSIAPRVFTFAGSVEYNNYEWNPNPTSDYLAPAMRAIRYADKYHVLLVPHPPPHASAPALPLCTASNHSGYYARSDSPYAPAEDGYVLQRNVLSQSFFAHDCLYRFVDADESFQCLAARFPTVHWFGDSNSRRALRQLYTANRWGEEMIRVDSPVQCEDQEELDMAGARVNSTEWPYPLPTEEGALCHYWRYDNYSYIRLPADTREPLHCRRATGSRLYYRFLLGMGFKHHHYEWFDNLMLGDYWRINRTADLVVINTGNWESQEAAWDQTQPGQRFGMELDEVAAQEYNLTWKLERLVDILHDYYVRVNPSVTIVFRGGNAWLTPRGESIRRHTTARLQSISERMAAHLQASRVGHRLLQWDVQATRAYTAHNLDKYATVGAACRDGHSGVRQVALDNQILLNGLCNCRLGVGGGC